MSHMTLVPAYGRDYKSKAAVLKDWEAGKDFADCSFGATGAYVSKRDIPPGTVVNIRYGGLRKVLVVRNS